jgi:hypothetical protein
MKPLLPFQGGGWEGDGFHVTRPIPTSILPLKGRSQPIEYIDFFKPKNKSLQLAPRASE